MSTPFTKTPPKKKSTHLKELKGSRLKKQKKALTQRQGGSAPHTIFFFFLSVKSKNIKWKFPRSTQDVDKRKPTHKRHERNPKPYLHPNHVRKSKTEFVLSLLYRLAQVHKLETKLILILWAEVTDRASSPIG